MARMPTTRRYYTMLIYDKPRIAVFKFLSWHKIRSVTELKNIFSKLRKETRKDKLGRILCYGGTPGYTRDTQKRIYIVKLGHDGKLWDKWTAQGQVIKVRLKRLNY